MMQGLVLSLVKFVKKIKVFIHFINVLNIALSNLKIFKTSQEILNTTEHVPLEDDSFEQDFCLEDLFAHEDTIDSQSRKRVRIEDIDDEDEVRFISVLKQLNDL